MKTKILKLLLTLSTNLIVWIIEKLTGQKLRPKANAGYCNAVNIYIHGNMISVQYDDTRTQSRLRHEY